MHMVEFSNTLEGVITCILVKWQDVRQNLNRPDQGITLIITAQLRGGSQELGKGNEWIEVIKARWSYPKILNPMECKHPKILIPVSAREKSFMYCRLKGTLPSIMSSSLLRNGLFMTMVSFFRNCIRGSWLAAVPKHFPICWFGSPISRRFHYSSE